MFPIVGLNPIPLDGSNVTWFISSSILFWNLFLCSMKEAYILYMWLKIPVGNSVVPSMSTK